MQPTLRTTGTIFCKMELTSAANHTYFTGSRDINVESLEHQRQVGAVPQLCPRKGNLPIGWPFCFLGNLVGRCMAVCLTLYEAIVFHALHRNHVRFKVGCHSDAPVQRPGDAQSIANA